MEIKTLPVSEALFFIQELVPIAVIANVMKVTPSVLTHAKGHHVVNGKPYYLPPEKTEQLRNAVREIGNDLLSTRLKTEYGDIADQLQDLKTTSINIRTLTTRYFGKSLGWMRKRMTHQPYKDRLGNERDYYNTFSEKDIRDINNAIHSMALDILSLEILDENPSDIPATVSQHTPSLTDDQELIEDEIALGLV